MTRRKDDFNQQLRDRTFKMATAVFIALQNNTLPHLARPAVNQLIRSSSSVASNWRAAARSRSDAEFYAKLCIVVEEIDETQFWLDYLAQSGMVSPDAFSEISPEVGELVRLFGTMKRTMKLKRKS